MEELRVAEVAAVEVAEDIAENVVEKAGMSFAAKAGVVGVVLVGAAAIGYGAVKVVKAIKAKKNADGGDDAVVEYTELKEETE